MFVSHKFRLKFLTQVKGSGNKKLSKQWKNVKEEKKKLRSAIKSNQKCAVRIVFGCSQWLKSQMDSNAQSSSPLLARFNLALSRVHQIVRADKRDTFLKCLLHEEDKSFKTALISWRAKALTDVWLKEWHYRRFVCTTGSVFGWWRAAKAHTVSYSAMTVLCRIILKLRV